VNFYIFSFKPRPTLFVVVLVSMFAVLGSIVWAAQIYFMKTGDLLSEDEVVEIQMATTDLCLYDTLAGRNHAAYKLALYRQINPKIVVIGSSRVLQFNAKMFSTSFLNLGRTMNYLAEGPGILTRLVQYGKPDLALIGFDFWWFNPNIKTRLGQSRSLVKIKYDNPAGLKSLIVNAIKRPRVLQALDSGVQTSPCPIGAAARLYLNGFGRDGMRYYGSTLTRTTNANNAYGFADTLGRIKDGKRGFEHAQEPDMEKIDRFISFVNSVNVQGIKTVVFAPPVSPLIAAAMKKSGNYGYVEKTMSILKKRGIEVFDFHNPDQIDLNDCEFIDGFHVGDVGSAKMLSYMARTQANLNKVLNQKELARISNFKDRAGVYFSEAFKLKEADFLNLGCVKSS